MRLLRRVFTPLPDEVLAELVALAEREGRHPKDQAAILIMEGLERARSRPSPLDAFPEPEP